MLYLPHRTSKYSSGSAPFDIGRRHLQMWFSLHLCRCSAPRASFSFSTLAVLQYWMSSGRRSASWCLQCAELTALSRSGVVLKGSWAVSPCVGGGSAFELGLFGRVDAPVLLEFPSISPTRTRTGKRKSKRGGAQGRGRGFGLPKTAPLAPPSPSERRAKSTGDAVT